MCHCLSLSLSTRTIMNGKGELARHRLWSFSLIFLSFNDVSEQLRKVARDQQAGNHDRERRAQWSTLGALSRSYYSYTIPREMEREGKKRSKVPNNIFLYTMPRLVPEWLNIVTITRGANQRDGNRLSVSFTTKTMSRAAKMRETSN